METITVGQLLFLLIISSAKVVIGSFNGNETDRLSLVEFKKAITRDPQQVMLSWNDSTHFCNWEGVLCRVKNPHRVTSLQWSWLSREHFSINRKSNILKISITSKQWVHGTNPSTSRSFASHPAYLLE